MEQQPKTGIMGGTFNPIHQGHLLTAEYARCFCRLSEVLFMPSGNSYMKNAAEIAGAEDRLAMLKLAVRDNPLFQVSDKEIRRKGPSYTFQTLLELKEEHPDTSYYFILGADNLFAIENWKEPQRIFENCTLIAAARGSRTEEALQQKTAELKQRFNARIILLPEKKFDLSSSEIRTRLRAGESVRYMLPASVQEYITQHQLYL